MTRAVIALHPRYGCDATFPRPHTRHSRRAHQCRVGDAGDYLDTNLTNPKNTMTKNRTEIRVTSIPSNSLTQTSNGAATAFGEVAMKSRPCLFTMGFEAASERITGKLPHLLAVALLAADARITAKKFADVAAVPGARTHG